MFFFFKMEENRELKQIKEKQYYNTIIIKNHICCTYSIRPNFPDLGGRLPFSAKSLNLSIC